MALTGAGIGATGVGTAAAKTVEPASGTDLRTTLGNVSDGDTVRLEAGGEYTISGDVTVAADDWTLLGNGATITGSGSYVTITTTGERYDIGEFYIDGPNDWSLRFNLKGGDWDFHNIAWLNRFGSNAQHHVITTNKTDGTTAVMSDLWFGAGLANGHKEGVFKAHPDGTVGDIEVRRCYFFQSGCYATNSSASGSARLQGTINFYDCFFDSCWHNFIRSGSHDAGPTTVENCVMVTDPAKLPSGPTRGVWAWYGTTRVVDTHISLPDDQEALALNEDSDGYLVMEGGAIDGQIHDSSADYELHDVGNDPRSTPPDQCVTTPEEAVEGNGIAVSTDPATNVGATTATVGGTLDSLPEGGQATVAVSYRPVDTDSWATTEAKTRSETGSFGFEVTGLAASTEYEYRAVAEASEGSVSGSIVTFRTVPENAALLEIQGSGTQTNYEFSVSGELQDDGDLEPWDDLSGGTANGWVTDEQDRDSFYFSGEITDFTFHEGSAAVYLDGEQVDPAGLGSNLSTLRIEGTGTRTNYEFTVSGDLRDTGDLEPWDDLSGGTANGWVTDGGHVDTFQFGGEITDFTFHEGSAAVYLDGEQVDPAGLGSNLSTLRIEGTGTRTNYEFTVSGDLRDTGDLEPWDDLSGGTANGWVTDGGHVDTFQFDGEITDFTFHEGSAAVYLDGEQVDPAGLV